MSEESWLHIYGQYAHHDEVIIVGSPEALSCLRDALNRVKSETTRGEVNAFVGDGEGYPRHDLSSRQRRGSFLGWAGDALLPPIGHAAALGFSVDQYVRSRSEG